MLLLIASQMFSDSSVVSSFLVRRVENESFPCMHNLDERTRQVWRENSRPVRTYEKYSRCCSPIRQKNTKHCFVPNQGPAFARPFGNGTVRVGSQGLFRWWMWGRTIGRRKRRRFCYTQKLPEVFFYLVSASAEEKGSRALSNIVDAFPNNYPYSRCLTI